MTNKVVAGIRLSPISAVEFTAQRREQTPDFRCVAYLSNSEFLYRFNAGEGEESAPAVLRNAA